MSHTAFAEERDIFLDFHQKNNPEKNLEVNRAPMRLPIEVVYYSDTNIIVVMGDESLDAEVFLINTNNNIEDYSSSLNTTFLVSISGNYIIKIQGNEWYAEGEIEI